MVHIQNNKHVKFIISVLCCLAILFSFAMQPFVVYAAWYNEAAYYYTTHALPETVVKLALITGGELIGNSLLPGAGAVVGAIMGEAVSAGISDLMAEWAANSSAYTQQYYTAEAQEIQDTPAYQQTIYNGAGLSLPLLLESDSITALEAAQQDGYITYTYSPGNLNIRTNANQSVSIAYNVTFSVPYGNYSISGSGIFHNLSSNLKLLSLQSNGWNATGTSDYLGLSFIDNSNNSSNWGFSSRNLTSTLYDGVSYRFRGSGNTGTSNGRITGFSNAYITVTNSAYTNQTPKSTRLTAVGLAAAQINNNLNNEFNFYLGTSDNQGNVNMIYDPDVFDEDTNTFKDPITGQTYTATSWEYHYDPNCRGYVLNFNTGTYSYNGIDIQHIYLLYANDALYILGYDDAGLQDAQDTGLYSTYSIFSRKFDYVIAQRRNTTVSPTTCEHVWTSETITAPTCTAEGLRRFTCSVCSTTHDEWIPATGHNYEYQGHTEAVYSQGGDIISPGYSTYECSVCEDTYVVYDTNTGPTQPVNPGGDDSGSGSGSGDDSGSGSIWEKIGQLLGSIVEGITSFVSSVLGAFLDALISLGSIIHERASALLEMILEWFDLIPQLFGGFLAFMTALFPFLPEEIIMMLEFGLAAVIIVGLIKLFRR